MSVVLAPTFAKPFIKFQKGLRLISNFLSLVANPQSLVFSFCLVIIHLKPQTCQRDSIYSFSLTAGKDKWLKRDRNCLPINRVPVGLSPDAADHAEGRRQEEAGEATITPRQGLFGARSQTSLTYAPWVESAYVTKQHEVAAPRYLCVSRAARGPLPVRLVCSLAGSHVT